MGTIEVKSGGYVADRIRRTLRALATARAWGDVTFVTTIHDPRRSSGHAAHVIKFFSDPLDEAGMREMAWMRRLVPGRPLFVYWQKPQRGGVALFEVQDAAGGKIELVPIPLV